MGGGQSICIICILREVSIKQVRDGIVGGQQRGAGKRSGPLQDSANARPGFNAPFKENLGNAEAERSEFEHGTHCLTLTAPDEPAVSSHVRHCLEWYRCVYERGNMRH